MKQVKVLILLLVILWLSGCVSGISETATLIPSTAPSTAVATQSISSLPTLTAEPTPSPEAFAYQCPDVAATLPSGVKPGGKLVLFAQHPFLLDLDTGTKKALDDNQGQFSVSPDGKWLASQYMDPNGKFWLLLETADGKQQKPIAWNDDWFFLAGWLDNEHVWISHYTEPLVTVVNPFNGTQQELVPDFPGLETIAQAGVHYALGANTVLYNSSLEYAIYPRLENDGYVYLVLWDLQANRVLAKIRNLAKSFEYYPIWSLDQTQLYVAVINKWDASKPDHFVYDFFSLNKDGEAHQLTDFGGIFNDVYIGGASLSPDGKKIAFWLQLGSTKEQLAVLDLDTKQVTSYCVPGGSPVWSLDSQYLTVSDQYEPNAGRVILVDIQHGWAAQVAEQEPTIWAAGWMVEP